MLVAALWWEIVVRLIFGKHRGYMQSPRAVYDISKRKSKSVHSAWIQDMYLHAALMVNHLQEFVTLWEHVREVVMDPAAHDQII